MAEAASQAHIDSELARAKALRAEAIALRDQGDKRGALTKVREAKVDGSQLDKRLKALNETAAPEADASSARGAAARWPVIDHESPRYVAWIQKFHYMRRLIERRINVLALDSDVVVTSDPYPHLRGPFGRFAMVTAFDTKGGFANINVGVVYTQNASVGGAVHALTTEPYMPPTPAPTMVFIIKPGLSAPMVESLVESLVLSLVLS